MPAITSNASEGCECCCPPDGTKCFQEWIAGWACVGQVWTGPVSDNRLCLPAGTSTEWVKTSGDATGCQYRKYVPYDPKHCCTSNGDCSGLGDTATPALPFGGGPPPDCCDLNECFQTWTASWSCDDQVWTGPTAGAKVCLPTGSSEDWTRTSRDEFGCSYRKYVNIGTPCALDADCAGPDTATPDLPFAGGVPDDCCAKPCCDPTTPFSWIVTFSDVENSIFKCNGECSYGNVIGGTGTLETYTLTQRVDDPCSWEFNGTGPSVIVGGDSPDCSGAGGMEIIGLRIRLERTGGFFILVAELLGTGAVTDPIWFSGVIIDGDCCTPKNFAANDNTAYDCSAIGINGSAVCTPTC